LECIYIISRINYTTTFFFKPQQLLKTWCFLEMFLKNGNKQQLFIGVYFVIASIGLIFDFLSAGSAFYTFKPFLSLSLIALYWKTSEQRNTVCFTNL